MYIIEYFCPELVLGQNYSVRFDRMAIDALPQVFHTKRQSWRPGTGLVGGDVRDEPAEKGIRSENQSRRSSEPGDANRETERQQSPLHLQTQAPVCGSYPSVVRYSHCWAALPMHHV